MRPALSDTIIVNTCAVTAEAERQARQAIRRAHREQPDARIVVTGCAAQIAPDTWAALPGVSRVLGNVEKLRRENWAADAGTAVSDIMQATETAAHLVTEFAGRARAFVQVQQGCDHRCTFCVIPFGRGPQPQRADRRDRRAGARAGGARVFRGRADRRRHRELRPGSAGRADARADGAPAAGTGAGLAAAAAVLARSGGDRCRPVAPS